MSFEEDVMYAAMCKLAAINEKMAEGQMQGPTININGQPQQQQPQQGGSWLGTGLKAVGGLATLGLGAMAAKRGINRLTSSTNPHAQQFVQGVTDAAQGAKGMAGFAKDRAVGAFNDAKGRVQQWWNTPKAPAAPAPLAPQA